MSVKKIQSALISVYYKDGLAPIIQELHKNGVTLYSTGGTQSFIEELGIPVIAVEDLTGYPSIFGGRVKTLHPKVFGGILHRRENESDLEEKQKYLSCPTQQKHSKHRKNLVFSRCHDRWFLYQINLWKSPPLYRQTQMQILNRMLGLLGRRHLEYKLYYLLLVVLLTL